MRNDLLAENRLYSKALPAVIPFDQVEKLNDVSVSVLEKRPCYA